MALIDDIKIGQSRDVESEIVIQPEPSHEAEIVIEDAPLMGRVFSLTAAEVLQVQNLSVVEGTRWIQNRDGEDVDEATAATAFSVAIALHRALGDMGLIIEYEMRFRI